jgi:sterol desaturase/sphingolipid hydroxylase (fatty acid hydroxylase superfamily)
MPLLCVFARYGYVPFMLIGLNGLALHLVVSGVRLWIVGMLALVALALAFLVERMLPYEQAWNESQGDAGKDAAHGLVYEFSNLGAILLLPLIVSVVPWNGFWPRHWPLWSQLLGAIVVADIAMTSIHYVSHRVDWLWRLHSVHHGVGRLYGFNGLVRHPLHQQIDLAIGTLPLVLAGMPVDVAVLLGLAMTVQLIVQHSNVDYWLGPFEHLLAIGPVHRLHHVNWVGEGESTSGCFSRPGIACWVPTARRRNARPAPAISAFRINPATRSAIWTNWRCRSSAKVRKIKVPRRAIRRKVMAILDLTRVKVQILLTAQARGGRSR